MPPAPRCTRHAAATLGVVLAAVLLALASAGCNFGQSTAPTAADASFDAAFSVEASPADHDAGPEADAAAPEAQAEAAPATYAIGGHVSGLAGHGLVLQDDGADDLPVAADGAFAFKTAVASGGAYAVTVATQPTEPTQLCTVTGGAGTAHADVTDVQVTCATASYSVSGTLVGLDPASTGGVVLSDTLGAGVVDTVQVDQNGGFTFPKKVASGGTYAVSVQTNPTSPAQTCSVSGGAGTVVAGAVTSVVVDCATNAYVLGGTVSGLAGQGLVLQNGSMTVSVSANGTFAFPAALPSGTAYAVAVQAQPRGPSQACTVTGGSGTIATADVTGVTVACVTDSFPVGGTVTGLAGKGLVLKASTGESLSVAADGAFAFATPIASGAPFSVGVAAQPTGPSQTCVVAGGTGTVGDGPVSTVRVTCSADTFPVSVTAKGVHGSGLTLTLDSSEVLAVPADGTYTFHTQVASGAAYAVAVTAQPSSPTQACVVANGSGTVGGGPVTGITVACSTNSYPVGGTLSGLLGSGLVLTNEGGDALTLGAGKTTFTFATAVASGSAYDVEIVTQPTNPSQTCTVSGNKGTVVAGAVSSVVVNCGTDSFTVGGTVTGLAGKGLVLANGAATVAVTAQGGFAFPPIASGTAYDVTVATQPSSPTQVCTVTHAQGTVAAANVTDVQVACATQSFPVGGTVMGLAGSGLVLEDLGADDLAVAQSGAFQFKTPVASGATYAATIKTQPTSPWQTCTASGASGSVGAGPVTSVQVGCTTNAYQVSASVSGLVGTGLTLAINGGSTTTVAASGQVPLGPKLASGSTYAVTVQTQPTGPTQACTVTGATGTVAGSDVVVSVACTTSTFAVGGSVAGLSGSGLVLTNSSNGDTVTVAPGATSFKLPTAVASGGTYFVAVSAQPSNPTQKCVVTGGSGKVGGGDVTTVVVNCLTQSYTIGGTIGVTGGGTLGSGLALTNGSETIHPTSTGTFSFQTPVASGATYLVSVTGQPSNPAQTCAVTGASGTVVASNVNTVVVTCTTSTFTVGGSVTGLAGGASVVLQDDGGDDLTVSANGSFTFKTPVASGAGYSVTVKTQPTSPWQVCTPTQAQGTLGGAPVTNVVVTCVTTTETVSGTVGNLQGAGLTLVLTGGQIASETLQVPAKATTFAFKTSVPSGSTYAVATGGKPQGPSETCAVSSGSGTIAGAAVTNVAVGCTVDTFGIGGTTVGLQAPATSPLVLTNGSDSLSLVSGQTSFIFPTKVASGQPYDVVVKTQPPGQSCALSGGSSGGGAGVVGNGAVSLTVNCTNQYTIAGQVSGLIGSGLSISDGSEVLPIAKGATSFAFTQPLASGATYTLSVTGQPTNFWETCTISPTGAQTITSNVSNVVVTCTPRVGTLNVTVVNGGPELQVADGLGETLGPNGGAFDVASGATYTLTVTNPAGKTCAVSAGAKTGTMGDPTVPLAATVTCTTLTFAVTVTVVNGTCPTCVDVCKTHIPLTMNSNPSVDAIAGGPFTLGVVPYGTSITVTETQDPKSTDCSCTITQGKNGQCNGQGCTMTVIPQKTVFAPVSATLWCQVPVN